MKSSPTQKLHTTGKDHTFRVQTVKTLIIFLTLSIAIFLIPLQAMAGGVKAGTTPLPNTALNSVWTITTLQQSLDTAPLKTPPQTMSPQVNLSQIEFWTATLPSTALNPGWTTITFQYPFDTIPLVFITATSDGQQPSAVRIKDVTTTDFLACQVEPPNWDGLHAPMKIHYLAISEGRHRIDEDDVIKAYHIETSAVQHGTGVEGSTGWDLLTWKDFRETPAVFAQIQTMNNEEGTPPITPSKPWLTTAMDDLTFTGGLVALERSEAAPGQVKMPEKIGYLAFPGNVRGTVVIGGHTINFVSVVTDPSIYGWDSDPGCYKVYLPQYFQNAPLVIASKSTRRGNDGGWLRRCSLDKDDLGLTVDEDTYLDDERKHTREAVSILAFSDNFHVTIPTDDVDPSCY